MPSLVRTAQVLRWGNRWVVDIDSPVKCYLQLFMTFLLCGMIICRAGSNSSVEEMLGNQGVTESNMMQYLGIIEQRTSEILQAYASSQQMTQAVNTQVRISSKQSRDTDGQYRCLWASQLTSCSQNYTYNVAQSPAQPPLPRIAQLPKLLLLMMYRSGLRRHRGWRCRSFPRWGRRPSSQRPTTGLGRFQLRRRFRPRRRRKVSSSELLVWRVVIIEV